MKNNPPPKKTNAEGCPEIWSKRGLELNGRLPMRPHHHVEWTKTGATIDSTHKFLYTSEFLTRVESETDWQRVSDQRPTTSPEDAKRIGLKEIECPLCRGHLRIPVIFVGGQTGLEIEMTQRCRCDKWRRFWDAWHGPAVPKRYREVALITQLEPSPLSKLSMERQRTIIDAVGAKPNHSYFFYGPSGTGKTHLSFALHRYQLAMWASNASSTQFYPNVCRANVTELIREHNDYVNRGDRDVKRPSIDLIRLRNVISGGVRPVLVLDELDKIGNPTEFKLTTILSLLDLVYNEEGQLIVTSNRGPEWFTEAWGEDFGGSILRRICGDIGAHPVPFLEKPQ